MVRIAATLMLAASTKALTRASFNRLTPTALLGSLLGANGDKYAGAVMGTEDIMKPKAHGMSTACIRQPFEWRSIVEPAVAYESRHASSDSPAPRAGTSATPVQKDLRWNCDAQTADRICNFNRHYAEFAGYWEQTSFLKDESEASGEISFYDSNTGNELFTAPKGRSFEQFVKESRVHGWPSFRDDEVNWDYVRVLPDGEAVSVDGTHLGHNLPDKNGNRYCINLVSVAGRPKKA